MPLGLTNLKAMLDAFALHFGNIYSTITQAKNLLKAGVRGEMDDQRLVKFLDLLRADLQKMELTTSDLQITRIQYAIGRRANNDELLAHIVELQNRMDDELLSRHFLFLPPNRASLYSSPIEGWTNALTALPQIQDDVEEGAKCLALSRYTATVFHCMRILEVGLRAIDPAVEAELKSPAWGEIISRYRKVVANAGTPAHHRREDAIAFLEAVRVAWRNPTVHVDRQYNEEQAKDIWAATRVFMSQLVGALRD
jgi:hypothetical protein